MKLTNKNKSILEVIIGIAIVVLVAFLSTIKYSRFDLTSEKRYSLAPATEQLLDSLDNTMFFKVYLAGDLQYDYQKLSQASEDLLEEFKAQAGDKIKFVFVDPNEIENKGEREELYKELTEIGLKYNAIKYEDEGTIKEQIIFPGALVYYNNKVLPLSFMKSQMYTSPSPIAIQNAINNLEYEFSKVIKKQLQIVKPRIAFTTGHGELSDAETFDISKALSEFYIIDTFNIKASHTELIDSRIYDAWIIAKPTEKFNEQEKFVIDQFIMKGGKTLWLIDPIEVSEDSLMKNGFSWGLDRDLNIKDILFKYGARINNNLVLDQFAAKIPLNDGMVNGRPNFKLSTWNFFPTVFAQNSHPITNNIDPVLLRYASSIDFVGDTSKVYITPILSSSDKTVIRNAPVRVALNITDVKPSFAGRLNKPYTNLGVLLEGEFESAFKGRVPANINNLPEFKYQENIKNNKMIIIGDGDVIKNDFNKNTGKISKLGYYKYTNMLYGNREFLQNAIDYLLDDNSLLSLRSRTITLRKLDTDKASNEKLFWQTINILLPILLIFILGVIYSLYRKFKYTK